MTCYAIAFVTMFALCLSVFLLIYFEFACSLKARTTRKNDAELMAEYFSYHGTARHEIEKVEQAMTELNND